MNKLKPLSLLMVLFVGAAFAADGVVPSRVVSPTKVVSGTENVVSRSTERVASRDDGTSGARVTSRGTSRDSSNDDKTTKSGNARVVSSSTVVSRGGTETNARKTDEGRTSTSAKRVGVNARANVSETGRRVTTRTANNQNDESANRNIEARAAAKTVTKESIAESKGILEQTAELNKSCQEQYNECMDQFCAIVDSNQKRCSCSSNLSKYSKVEEAVKSANDKLNEVAQNIRYVGLSADEIRAIMTATEAEEELAGSRDTTENRNMLEQIEKMIKDPQSATASYSSDSFGIDMNLDFSSEADIFNLDFLNTNTTSFSNLRGTELYNAAKSRCNAVLNQCKKAGATVTQVTGNYDLSIDKDCVAYEDGLKKMNETLVSNVRSAERMLQKARLAVLQNKNQYDARGCVAALESCMTDEMVCGSNYYKCIDPTKIYIDENGEVVPGQDISMIQAFMREYNNASIDSDFLSTSYSNQTTISKNGCAESPNNTGRCVVKYLMQKIGTKQKSTDEGLCRPVLDKCQYYTYKDKTYEPYNDIVVNYVQRALSNIKSAQYKIISEYASTCVADVAACYNQQVSQVNTWASSASSANVYSVMRGACRNVSLTCGLAVFAGDPDIMPNENMMVNGVTYHISGCPGVYGKTYGSAQYNDAIIDCISDMFYQSLLCPDNSIYVGGDHGISDNGTASGYVNKSCTCNGGYVVWSGKCIAACPSDQTLNLSTGTCYCTDTNKTLKSGVCVENSTSTSTNSSDSTSSTTTIKYNCGGGVGSPANATAVYGTVFTAASSTACSRTGYTFAGWQVSGTVGLWNGSATWQYQGGEKTFTAQWTANTYTVQFSGCTSNPSSIQCTYDQNCPTLPSACTISGAAFSAWSYNGQDYQPGATTVRNLTSQNNATITMNAKSGTACLCSTDPNIVKTVACTGTANGSQCTYSGTCKTGYSGFKSGTEGTANMECNPKTYTVKYVCGTTQNDQTSTVSTGTSFTPLAASSICPACAGGAGYGSWVVSGISVGNSMNPWNYDSSNGTVTLTATCGAPVLYRVAFDRNNASGTGAPSDSFVDCQISSSTCSCATWSGNLPDGYRFSGWNTQANGSGTTYTTNCATGSDITLYAVWTENAKVTITYDCDGGSGTVPAQTVQLDANDKGSAQISAISGCGTKVGYNRGTVWLNGTSEVNGNGSYTMTNITTDVNLKAKWTKKEFGISYSNNGGTCTTGDTQAVYETSFNPGSCTKAGATFAGWKIGNTNDIKKGSFTWNYDDGTTTTWTLTAQWGEGEKISCASTKYLPRGGQSAADCASCTAGNYCPGVSDVYYNATSDQGLNACSQGSYSSAGAYQCTPCAGGKTNSGSGNTTACTTTCSNNSHVATWKTPSWSSSSNTVSDLCKVNTCDTGYKPNSDNTACVQITCDSTQYLDGSTCKDCTAGYYCDGSNRIACANGSYSSANATSCTACAGGKTNSGTGNTTACTTTCSNNSHVATWKTPSWSSSSNTVSDLCKINSCSSGWSVNSDNTSCIQDAVSCSAGQYLPKNSSSCAACPTGKYCSSSGSYTPSSSSDQGITGNCTGKVDNSSYTGTGATTSTGCNWQCDDGYDPQNTNKPSSCTASGGGGSGYAYESFDIDGREVYVCCDHQNSYCFIAKDSDCSDQVGNIYSDLKLPEMAGGGVYACQGVCCTDYNGDIIPYDQAIDTTCFDSGKSWNVSQWDYCDHN